MRQAHSSISAFLRHFVKTCTAQLMAGNPGQNCSLQDRQREATSNGLLSIRPMAQDTASNTRRATGLTAVATACNFNGLLTAGLPGRRLSSYRRRTIHLQTEHSTSTRMGTFLLAAKDSA